jgi:hypothetical protein
MADVVYWGNNSTTAGEYTAPKEVASVAIAQLSGGIKVDWSAASGIPADIDVLEGNTYRNELVDDIPRIRNSACLRLSTEDAGVYTIFGRWGSCSGSRSYSTSGSYLRIEVYSEPCLGSYPQCGEPFRLVYGLRLNGTWHYINGDVSWGLRDVSLTKTSDIADNPRLFKRRISSEQTNDFSERLTSINPSVSLIPGGCAIAIAYTDSSTEQIPLSECYQWARFRDDQECPEGTCTVDCGDHRCCYDPNTGIAVKVIPL